MIPTQRETAAPTFPGSVVLAVTAKHTHPTTWLAMIGGSWINEAHVVAHPLDLHVLLVFRDADPHTEVNAR